MLVAACSRIVSKYYHKLTIQLHKSCMHKKIQLWIFCLQISVHFIVSNTKVVDVRPVSWYTRKLHIDSSPKWLYTEVPFTATYWNDMHLSVRHSTWDTSKQSLKLKVVLYSVWIWNYHDLSTTIWLGPELISN